MSQYENPLNAIDEKLVRYADDRLDADERAQVDEWLLDKPEMRERIAQWKQQDDALHQYFDPIANTAIPAHLLRTARRASRRSPLRYAAAVAWLSVGLITGWFGAHAVQDKPMMEASFPRIAAVAHATYVPEKRHPVEVAADQEAHLVTWLSKKLGHQLRVPQLNDKGYALVGGRLLPSETGPVALFMFQNDGGSRLTLYLRTRPLDVKETSFRFSQEGKVSVFYWLDDQLSYALSGEVDRAQLLALAQEAFTQLSQTPQAAPASQASAPAKQ